MSKRKVAIIGSGNIGTDLMIKILRHGQHLEMAVMVGIDPQSDGLARARRMGVATTHEGVIGLMNMPEFADIDIVFDATSAGAHVKNDAALREAKPDIRLIDLTPAAIGPYSQPIDLGNMVFVSGQIPVDPATGAVAEGIAAQADQSCRNVGAILEAAGVGFDKVVKTTCFLADIADFAAFNEVYARYFTSKPARSCVAVKDLPKGVLCEIEAIAEA